MRSLGSCGGAGCAAKLGVGLIASGCAGGLTGVGLTAAFAVGLAFLGDTRRRGEPSSLPFFRLSWFW